MTNTCNLVFFDLKTNPKNTRGEIISNLAYLCDSNIFIVDSWLEGVTIIPYHTSSCEAISEVVNKTDAKHVFLKPTVKQSVFIAQEHRINIIDDKSTAAYTKDLKRNLKFVFVFEVNGNNFRFKEVQALTYNNNINAKRRDKIPYFIKPRTRVVEQSLTLDLAKYEGQVEILSLQECIVQIAQPDGSRTVINTNVQSDSFNTNIGSSDTDLQKNSPGNQLDEDGTSYLNPESTGQPLVTGFQASIPYSTSQDNVQTCNVIISSRGVDTSRPMHPLYESCDSRLRSYATWRQFQHFDIFALAEAGLFNIGESNETVVRCFYCGIDLVNLAYSDNPRLEHMRKSPNCGYLKQNQGEQELASYQERIRNGIQSSQQANDHAGDLLCASASTHEPGSTLDHIRSPQYQAYSIRLATFARWPSDIRQRPEQVANAGLYYTGLQDVVRCFACDGGLKNWDPDDEPWIEHARWFPQCPFVKRVKGQDFIDLVRRMTEESDEEEDAVVHSTFQPNNPMADAFALKNYMSPQTHQVNQSSVLESVAARSVIETGYPPAVVVKAINVLLNKGQTEYTADDIMNIVFQMEDSDQFSQILREHYEDEDSRPGPGSDNCINGSAMSLQQENERLRRNMKCVNCRNEMRNILLLPCTHFCLCSTCSETSHICPLCFKRIREKIKTYVI